MMKKSSILLKKCTCCNVRRCILKRTYCTAATFVNTADQVKSNVSVQPFEAIPGPRSLPIIGTVYKYLPGGEYNYTNRIDSDWIKFKRYGDIVREEIAPGQTIVHLFAPELIEKVYRHEGKYPFRGTLKATEKYRKDKGLPDDLANAKGPHWYSMRSPANKEVMQPLSALSYVKVQDEVCFDLVKSIRDKRDSDLFLHDALEELHKFAMEAIGAVIFDRRLGMLSPEVSNTPEAQQMFKAVENIFEGLYKVTFMWPLHKSGKTKTYKEYVKATELLEEIMDKHLSESLNRAGALDENNMAQKLLNRGLSETEATEIARGIFFGGVDTTSITLLYLLYNLARNPDKQEKLYEEVKHHIPNPDMLTTKENLEDMKYLRSCTKESLRLVPTTQGSMRILAKDVTLGGYNVPAGTWIALNNSVVCKRDDVFREPDKYMPERWMKETKENFHPYAFLPFSHGVRNCLGKRFAEQEIRLAAIKVVNNFRVEYHGPPIKLHSKMINYPAGKVSLKFIERN